MARLSFRKYGVHRARRERDRFDAAVITTHADVWLSLLERLDDDYCRIGCRCDDCIEAFACG